MWTPGSTRARHLVSPATCIWSVAVSGLHDGESVARRVAEPRDVGPLPVTADDAPLVGWELRVAVDPGLHAPSDEVVDRRVDVRDREVQDREARRLMIRLRIDEHGCSARQLQVEETHRIILDVEPESGALELSGRIDVLDAESAERTICCEGCHASMIRLQESLVESALTDGQSPGDVERGEALFTAWGDGQRAICASACEPAFREQGCENRGAETPCHVRASCGPVRTAPYEWTR